MINLRRINNLGFLALFCTQDKLCADLYMRKNKMFERETGGGGGGGGREYACVCVCDNMCLSII